MAKSDRTRYVSTFRAPTEYERQLEEARRRAALAEALAQQQYQPMEGTVAPIPKAAPLVKALQGYLTAREGRMAREAAEEAKGMEADYAQRMLGRMEGGYTYQPNTALEQQMAKRPEETLDQYNQRIAATPFTAPAAPVPEQIRVDEVTRQSQYRRAPEEVLGMASTSLGTAALKDRPFMAARLAEMLKTPETKTMEFGDQLVNITGGEATPVTMGGKPLSKEKTAKAPETHGNLQWNAAAGKWEVIPEYKTTPSTQIITPRDKAKDEAGLRDQLQGRLKEMDWEGVKSAYQRIFTAPENAVGDVAIVYAVAKADDPTGAVRKEDFDLRAKEGSFGGRIKSLYEEAASGRMLPQRRQELIDAAYELYKARENEVQSLLGEYGNIAKRSELNVENVVNPFKSKVLERRIVWSAEKQKELDELARKRAGG